MLRAGHASTSAEDHAGVRSRLRARTAALHARLAELRADPPRRLSIEGHFLSIEGHFASEQEVWGALYAVEGSRLGNKVLLRKVTEHGSDLERRATRFLAHRPEDAVAWPRLVARLEALDYRGEDFESMACGAERVFDVYLVAAERYLDPERR
jgi:heme oxygenase